MKYTIAILFGVVLVMLLVMPASAAGEPQAQIITPVDLQQDCNDGVTECNCDYVTGCTTYVSGRGGTYICCPVKREADGTLRAATQEELAQLADAINQLQAELPSGAERDQRFAQILAEQGFVLSQTDMSNSLFGNQVYVSPYDIDLVQQIYNDAGMHEEAVDFGMLAARKLPKFVIGNAIEVDPNTGNRLRILQKNLGIAKDNALQAQVPEIENGIASLAQKLHNSFTFSFTGGN